MSFRPASASPTASVTSMVLASGSLTTATLMAGLPLVREMLVGRPSASSTSATSRSITGPDGPEPTTRLRISSTDPSVWVVLTGMEVPPPNTSPVGSVTLFSLRAFAIWGRAIPLAIIRSGSAETRTCLSTSPVTSTCRIRLCRSVPEECGTVRIRKPACRHCPK